MQLLPAVCVVKSLARTAPNGHFDNFVVRVAHYNIPTYYLYWEVLLLKVLAVLVSLNKLLLKLVMMSTEV